MPPKKLQHLEDYINLYYENKLVRFKALAKISSAAKLTLKEKLKFVVKIILL